MTQSKTPRAKIFLAAFTAALALPAGAAAHCGTMQGSFKVTCEQGVKVYRHQALSGIPQGLSAERASLKREEIRAETARAQIASDARIAAAKAKLRERELALEELKITTNANRRGNRRYFIPSTGFRSGFHGGFNRGPRPRGAFRQKH